MSKLAPLPVGIFKNGELIRVTELDDPREGLCREFNAFPVNAGMHAEVITREQAATVAQPEPVASSRAKRTLAIPANLCEYVDHIGVIPETVTRKQLIAFAKQAQKLTKAMNGAVRVEYVPATWYSDDEGSKGNLFYAFVEDDESPTLDARNGDLADCLAGELRRIAEFYLRLADRAAALTKSVATA